MHLKLKPCPPSSYPRAAIVENRAYSNNPFSEILFPGPFPDNIMELRSKEIASELEAQPANRWFEVVDTEAENPDEGIAFAKWQIFKDELPGPRQNRRFGKGCNVEACERLFGRLAELREKYVGDKNCLFLHILVTDPTYARRGAGGMLLKWGTDLADELGLPIYLESSPGGHGLYLKHGFRDLELYELDLSEYGASEMHQVWLMMYYPRKQGS